MGERRVNESELFGLRLSGFLPGTVQGRRVAATFSAVTSISPPARPLRDRFPGNVRHTWAISGSAAAGIMCPAFVSKSATAGRSRCVWQSLW